MSTILSLLYADHRFTQNFTSGCHVSKMIQLQKSLERRNALRQARRVELRRKLNSRSLVEISHALECHAGESLDFQHIKFRAQGNKKRKHKEQPLVINPRTIVGKYVKMYGFYGEWDDAARFFKVHKKKDKKQKEPFSVEVLLNEKDIEDPDDEFMDQYVKDPQFKFFQPENFEFDVFPCSDEERDAAIALHNKIIADWKAKKIDACVDTEMEDDSHVGKIPLIPLPIIHEAPFIVYKGRIPAILHGSDEFLNIEDAMKASEQRNDVIGITQIQGSDKFTFACGHIVVDTFSDYICAFTKHHKPVMTKTYALQCFCLDAHDEKLLANYKLCRNCHRMRPNEETAMKNNEYQCRDCLQNGQNIHTENVYCEQCAKNPPYIKRLCHIQCAIKQFADIGIIKTKNDIMDNSFVYNCKIHNEEKDEYEEVDVPEKRTSQDEIYKEDEIYEEDETYSVAKKYYEKLDKIRQSIGATNELDCKDLTEVSCKDNAHRCRWLVEKKPPVCAPISTPTLDQLEARVKHAHGVDYMEDPRYDEPSLPTWKMFTEHLNDAIRQARHNVSSNLPFAGRSSLPLFKDSDVLSGSIQFRYDKIADYISKVRANWTLYNSGKTTTREYKPEQLASTDDNHIFVEIFRKCFSFIWYTKGRKQTPIANEDIDVITDDHMEVSYTKDMIIDQLWADLYADTNKSDKPPYTKTYILSKPKSSNMSWHKDKNTGTRKTNMVIYLIIGPKDSYSVFFTFYTTNEAARKALVAVDNDKYPVQVKMDSYLKNVRWDKELHRIENPQNVMDRVKNILQEEKHDDIIGALNSIQTFALWARQGDIIVFDGSSLHGVSNDVNFTDKPQIVLAINVGNENGII